MNKFYRIGFCWMGCLLGGLSTPFAQAETLKVIYQQALENDHGFLAARADRDAGLETKTLARSALLPQIDASAAKSISRFDSKAPNSNNPNVASGTQKVDVDQSSYGVGLRQSIVDVSQWHNYARGKALSNLAETQFALAEQNLIIRVTSAYFEALKAVDNLATAKSEETALARQLEQTKQRFAVGLTAITEVHEAQAAFDSAVAERLLTNGQLGIAFESLEVLTGKSYGSLAPLSERFPVLPPTPTNREEWVSLSKEYNVAIKGASLAMQAEEAKSKAAKSEYYPKLTGSLSYGGSDMTRDDVTLEDQTGTTVRLELSVPLYTGGRISASRRQTYSQYLSAKEQYLQTTRDVVQQTHSQHLAVLTSAAGVKARQQAITSSKSALDATKAGYDVGTRDLVDVLNAQRNVFRAQRDYYDTLYGYVVSTLRLKQAAGILTDKDVDELEQWLDTSRPVRNEI